MMLENRTQQQIIIPKLEEAKGFWARGRGLLGRSHLPAEAGLWIHHCNSIHTFFMKFAIDCVFVDRKLKVRAVYNNIQPWRLILPVWGASSVFELSSGTATKMNIQKGDQLHVGD